MIIATATRSDGMVYTEGLGFPTNCGLTGNGNRRSNSLVSDGENSINPLLRLIIVEIQIEMVGLPAWSTCLTCSIICLPEMREIWMLIDCTWSLYKRISIWSFVDTRLHAIHRFILKMGFSCVEIRSYLAQRVISASLWSTLMCGCRMHLIYIQLRFSDGIQTGSACAAASIKFKSNIYLNFMHRLVVDWIALIWDFLRAAEDECNSRWLEKFNDTRKPH